MSRRLLKHLERLHELTIVDQGPWPTGTQIHVVGSGKNGGCGIHAGKAKVCGDHEGM